MTMTTSTTTATISNETYAPTGSSAGLPAPAADRTQLISDIADQATGLRDVSHLTAQDIARFTDGVMSSLLEQKTQEAARRSVSSLANSLGERGFAWRDVARLAGVTVPALRKWRMGEPASPNNRRKLAQIVALVDVIEDRCPDIEDVVSWLEVPVLDDAPTSPMDMLAHNRFDLVCRYATDTFTSPEAILDDYEPDWRERYASAFETFVGSDGYLSLRLVDSQE